MALSNSLAAKIANASTTNILSNNSKTPPRFSWILSNLLRESGYIETIAPFTGGPYYFRKSDATFWELQEIQRKSYDTKPDKVTTILCFNKVSRIDNCESIQESYNLSLGTFNSNDNTGASAWNPASRNDLRRISYNTDAQTKAPYTMAISLNPEIMDTCIEKHKKINKNTKLTIYKDRDSKVSKIATKLNLQPLDELPLELSRYSKKRKRRYYMSSTGGGPDGDKALIWYINHMEIEYEGQLTVHKLESYDEIKDVCQANKLEMPSRQIYRAQRNILYIE